jgi:hypothetical protein
MDMGYLPSHCRVLAYRPEDCDNLHGGSSHSLVVSGYDATSIYINDAVWPDGPGHPTDPKDPRFKNMKIPTAEFMEAWERSADIAPMGPWWMLFIEQTSAAQMARKSVPQILAMQKELSRNVVADIDAHASSAEAGPYWQPIAVVRRLFGDYLVEHGYPEAGALYRSLADDYQGCESMTASQVRARLTGTIRAREVEVRSKY